MAIAKKSPFAIPKSRTRDENDKPTKQDLVGELIVVTLTSYNPALPTTYGSPPAAFCDLIVVSGKHHGRYDGWAAFGLLGKQIGEALEEGQTAPCRVISGSKGNRSWIEADFNVSAEDTAAALDAYNATAPAPF